MPRYGLPWIVLVSPTAAWRALLQQKPTPWPALMYQILLLCVGWIAAQKPMGELAEISGIGKGGSDTGALIVGLFVIVAVQAILAALVQFTVQIVSQRPSFNTVFTWLAYGTTPLFLGRFLGLLSFAVFQPLAQDKAGALALQVNPLSLSLAGLFPPVSLPWTIASQADIFALWSLAILALGAVHYLRLNAARAAAVTCTLLLIWLVALTLMWQGLQRSL
jgi:hypothetical protein